MRLSPRSPPRLQPSPTMPFIQISLLYHFPPALYSSRSPTFSSFHSLLSAFLIFALFFILSGTKSQLQQLFLYTLYALICVLHRLLFSLFTKTLYIEKVVPVPYSCSKIQPDMLTAGMPAALPRQPHYRYSWLLHTAIFHLVTLFFSRPFFLLSFLSYFRCFLFQEVQVDKRNSFFYIRYFPYMRVICFFIFSFYPNTLYRKSCPCPICCLLYRPSASSFLFAMAAGRLQQNPVQFLWQN